MNADFVPVEAAGRGGRGRCMVCMDNEYPLRWAVFGHYKSQPDKQVYINVCEDCEDVNGSLRAVVAVAKEKASLCVPK